MLQRRRATPLGVPLLFSLAGLAFAAWTAYTPTPDDCASAGCVLFRDLEIFGVSLWLVGAGAFSLLTLAALFGRGALGYGLAGLFLTADAALLLLMAVTAPCANCLVIAVAFALAFWAFRASMKTPRDKPGLSYLLLIWGALFVTNVIGLAEERMPPWILHGQPAASVRLYFSPSCPACREAILGLLPSAKDVAFIPVAENEDDINAIAVMRGQISDGSSFFLAYRHATEATPRPIAKLTLTQQLSLRFDLLRNKALVFASGSDKLPLIQTHGLPRLPTTARATSQDASLPIAPLDFEGCSGAPAAAPCPEKTTPRN